MSNRKSCAVAAKPKQIALSLLLACSFTVPMNSSLAASGIKGTAQEAVKTSKQKQNKSSEQAATQPGDALRLPRTVMPESYELSFEPDLNNFTYEGTEAIELNIKKPVAEISLNSLELEIVSNSLEKLDASKELLTGKVEVDQKNEQVRFLYEKTLSPGKYRLKAKFKGILNDQLRGFYRSYFKDQNGEKHWLCSSQMEPADARRMFPCFDEPEFKATFQITAIIDPKLTAISNAPVAQSTETADHKKKILVFEPSPKMSTYLMVLVVGDFKATQTKTACNVPIRVWAPSGQEKMGEFSLSAACEVMSFLSEYFGIKFPAKKLDLIAIPDFAPGAMENLGAITFKDSLLLIDEKTGSNFARRSALSVIAHEMAHQWFGDLVTTRWWDDLWLNEAFATWAATKTENALRPEWRIRSKAVLERADAMNTDQLASTRAIHAHVGNPKQASEMFDAITYDKGSAVLRMLEVFVGEKTFQKGVHDFLESHKFDNASSEDLWQSIAASARNVPVSEMMKTWILQAGFPLIKVSPSKDGKSMELLQERFLVLPDAKVQDSLWMVPVMMRKLTETGSSPEDARPYLLRDRKASVPLAKDRQTTLLNAGASGFYRVLYGEKEMSELLSKFKHLSPDEKLSLMSDIKTLARKGSIPVENSLDLMLKIREESDPIVLDALAARFSAPKDYMDESSRTAYEKLVCAYLGPLKQRLGWDMQKGEEETLKDLRADVIKELGTFGQQAETIKEARALFRKYMQDRESVSPDMAACVLDIVAYNGSSQEYEEIKSAWKKATNPQEEKRFLFALARFRQAALIDRTLELALSSETRATDCVSLLTSLLSSSDSNERAWQFTKSHWDELRKKFPPRFNKRIVGACESLDRPELEKDLNLFFTDHPVEMAGAAVARTLEGVHISVLYRQRNEDLIRQWVQKQAKALP